MGLDSPEFLLEALLLQVLWLADADVHVAASALQAPAWSEVPFQRYPNDFYRNPSLSTWGRLALLITLAWGGTPRDLLQPKRVEDNAAPHLFDDAYLLDLSTVPERRRSTTVATPVAEREAFLGELLVSVPDTRLLLLHGQPEGTEWTAVRMRLAARFLGVPLQDLKDCRGGNHPDAHARTSPVRPGGLQPHLFEPFFSTKAREHGSGLGLSISAETVRKHGGELSFTTEQGRGTRFHVKLPRRTGLVPTRRPEQAAPAVPSRRLRLLVIDDEPMLLSACERTLGRRFAVTTALGGRQGLARIEEDAGWDAILCDLMMPDLDGPAVHAQVQACLPRLERRLLFYSGGAFTPRCRDFAGSMTGRVLDKLMSTAELEAAISQVVLSAEREHPGAG